MSAAPETRNLRLGAPGCDDSRRSPDEIRIIKETTAQEVELFLASNQIDTAAARELRIEAPWVSWAVLERGPLRACTNPSGALVARIRDAKRGLLGVGRPGTTTTPLPENATELEKFLHENRIDQAGVASLRCELLEITQAVIQKGPLINTNNPSASLMARIRMVKMDQAAGTGFFSATAPSSQTATTTSAPQALENKSDGLSGAGATGLAGAKTWALGAEALKAIQKLNANVVGLGSAQPQAGVGADPGRGESPAKIQKIDNKDDKNLQSEALKAIQALNSRNDKS